MARCESPKQPPDDGRLDIGELKKRIEKQTGFPSELKVARTALNAGWTYVSNPRFKKLDGSLSEVDLHCIYELSETEFVKKNKITYILVSLVIDVKSYSRPIVVFSSPMTDRDSNYVYADVSYMPPEGELRAEDCFLTELLYGFASENAGRSAVVVNGEGRKSNEYDINQISSAVRGLYEAAHLIRKEFFELAAYFQGEEASYVHIMVPVIVCDGDLLEYTVRRGRSSLVRRQCIELHNSLLGHAHRLDQCPTYIVTLKAFQRFLSHVQTSVARLDSASVKYALNTIRPGVRT